MNDIYIGYVEYLWEVGVVREGAPWGWGWRWVVWPIDIDNPKSRPLKSWIPSFTPSSWRKSQLYGLCGSRVWGWCGGRGCYSHTDGWYSRLTLGYPRVNPKSHPSNHGFQAIPKLPSMTHNCVNSVECVREGGVVGDGVVPRQ